MALRLTALTQVTTQAFQSQQAMSMAMALIDIIGAFATSNGQ